MSVLVFWGLLGFMTLVALAFVLVPLLRWQRVSEISRREVNIAAYRERLQDIEQAQTAGDCSVEEAAAARAELEFRLVNDVAVPASLVGSPRPAHRRAAGIALALLLPALAAGTYLFNSDWRLALAGSGPEAVELLLRRLERHLESEPADARGWQLLAQSRLEMRRYDAAAAAFARLNALSPTPDGLVAEAEARAMAAGGSLQGHPDRLIGQALQIDATSARAQWYAGMVAWQRGDRAGALKHWERVARQELPQDFRQLLEAQILQAGGKPPAAPVSFRIPVQVSLDPRLADRVVADMPVFVYARAAGQGGPPLVVARRRAAELPLTVVLDDSQSMLPDRKLSSVDRWTITARVARQGSADSRSGDLFAERQIERGQLQAPVILTINRTVP